MTTVVPSENVKCWNGTTYGYNTSTATRRKKTYRAFGKEELEKAIGRSQEYLLSIFNPDKGLWVAELEANTTLTSEYIYFMHFMGAVDDLRQRKMVHYLKETQLRGRVLEHPLRGPGRPVHHPGGLLCHETGR